MIVRHRAFAQGNNHFLFCSFFFMNNGNKMDTYIEKQIECHGLQTLNKQLETIKHISKLIITGIPSKQDIESISTLSYLEFLDLSHANMMEIEDHAFSFMHSLHYIKLPSSLNKISESALCGCYSLQEISIEDNPVFFSENKSLCQHIEGHMTLIKVPSGTSKTYITPKLATHISASAFNNCNKIQNLIFGESVTELEEPEFYECKFDHIECKSHIPPICHRNFHKVSRPCKTLIVPQSDVQIYQTKTYWNNFIQITGNCEASAFLF